MSQPEGIAKNNIIRDHAQQLSPDPAEIKKIGISLRMHFRYTFMSETGLWTERKTKTLLFFVEQDLKWAKEQAKKYRENMRKKNHQFSRFKGIEWLA